MWFLEKHFCQKDNGEYETNPLISRYKVVATLLCKIYGLANSTQFKLNWTHFYTTSPCILYILIGKTSFLKICKRPLRKHIVGSLQTRKNSKCPHIYWTACACFITFQRWDCWDIINTLILMKLNINHF